MMSTYYCTSCGREHKPTRGGKPSKMFEEHREFAVDPKTINETIVAERRRFKMTSNVAELLDWAKAVQNTANWYRRMDWFILDNLLGDDDVRFMMFNNPLFRKIPHSADMIIRRVGKSWKAFFAARKSFFKDRSKFKGMPKEPGYADHPCTAEFDYIQCKIKDGEIHFPASAGLEPVPTSCDKLKTVRLVPDGEHYWVEVTRAVPVHDLGLSKERAIGIDLGIKHLATIIPSFYEPPMIVPGGPVRSVNQFWNKERARLQEATKRSQDSATSKTLERQRSNRNNFISNHLHQVSRAIVNWCIANNVGRIAIGYNSGWKQGVNLGVKTNQKFTQIPFLSLVQKIEYKAALVGIEVKLVTEEYTSKCSFLDNEKLGKKETYLGKRVRRGLYVASDGTKINADVNGAGNILRKAFPEVEITNGIGALVRPRFLDARQGVGRPKSV